MCSCHLFRKDVLRKELDGAQKRSFELLKDSMRQVQEVEQQVHVVDSHLSRLKIENSRFTEVRHQGTFTTGVSSAESFSAKKLA